jgi:probable phosphoglycerate mutase
MASSANEASARCIYLLRHAEPLIEPGGRRYIGRTDPPLSPGGIDQAERWREYFDPMAINAFFSSDLQRAAHTARIIARKQESKVLLLPELRELNLGAWEGLTFDDVQCRDPEGFAQRGRDPAHYRPPGGESFDDLRRRVVPAFERIVSQAMGQVLVVGHAGVNRVILCHLLGMPLAHLFRLGQDYAGLNILEPWGDVWRVRRLNLNVKVL